MAGFPTRFSRSALGPKPQNNRLVKSARRELGADIGDMMLHASAAVGVMSPLAYFSFARTDQPGGVWADGPVVLRASGEAWDPDSLFAPTVTRDGVGHYEALYPATVTDKDDVTATLTFNGALWNILRSSNFPLAQVAWTSRPIVIDIATPAAAPLDADLFTLVLW